MSERGTVVAAFGRHYAIALVDGELRQGYPKGKQSLYAVGDEVDLSTDGGILGHQPRRSLLYRSDAHRQKLIAANVTQLALVVATEPSFSDLLISRALVAAEQQGLRSLLVLNKCDLTAGLAAAREALAPFAALGYPVIELAAREDASPLRPRLAGETTLLLGQSGMGKSTLTNALVPDSAAATREISTALDSGKHTTTHARMYFLPPLPTGGRLIDSPGLQAFGLAHLTPDDLAAGFIEFRPLLGNCRFRNCRHQAEPDCAIKAAVAAGAIHPRRLAHYQQLIGEAAA